MKPTYEPRAYSVSLFLSPFLSLSLSLSLSLPVSILSRSCFRGTRLRLAIITAPDIHRHGIRARRLISSLPVSLLLPSPSEEVRLCTLLSLFRFSGRTGIHAAKPQVGWLTVPPKFRLIAQLVGTGTSLGL